MIFKIFDNIEECNEEEVKRLLASVSWQRKEQALQFKFLFGQYACLKSYEILCDLLRDMGIKEELPEFEYGEYGKPFLKNHSNVHFSISHCKKAIAVAIDTHPIGIDIESLRKENISLTEYTMNELEQNIVAQSQNHSLAFAQLWTKKEAWLKYKGTGIKDNLQNVLLDCENVEFTTMDNLEKEYVCTICTEKVRNKI